MAATPGLPAGERLPEYDDEPAVEPEALRLWLVRNLPMRWDANPFAHHLERSLVSDVVRALQAVADAQLVKNGTYRAMARDGRDVERLAAWLANSEPITLMEHDGNPVDAAIFLLNAARSAAERGQV